MKRTASLAAALVIFGFAFASLADSPATKPAAEPSTQPAVISVTDQAALKEKSGFKVTVEGVVDAAEWSSSGKVMNLHFKDVNEDTGIVCCAFSKSKPALDKAFGGDATKAWSGAKVQITGPLHKYTGKFKAMIGRLQIIIQDPDQVKIIEPAAK